MTEIERIKKMIEEMSMEEFEKILCDCGIESVKPSIESIYVKCLKVHLERNDYKKYTNTHNVKKEYYEMDVQEPEVA